MKYKYGLGDAAKMNSQELLKALLARELAPSVIVGTGYKNARQVAINYLKEEIDKEESGAMRKESYYTTCEECEAVCEGEAELDVEAGDLYGLVCPNCGEFDVLNWADPGEEE
jgi:hypothetical protein